ncbi:MAG TPA: hypothetical protein VGC99_16405 [Candidatus Tectomicrobia bacterium]
MMAQEPIIEQSLRSSAVKAGLLRDFQVQIVINRSHPGKGHGPWSFIIDEAPEAGSSGVEPSPAQVAIAGLAA